jgi:adenosylcobinamide kinase / adenosylcobinamide-phosphate guanylyltransferase
VSAPFARPAFGRLHAHRQWRGEAVRGLFIRRRSAKSDPSRESRMDAKLVEARSVLVLGGARSGKSAYARGLAEAAAPERVYLATAEAGDAEMAARIARHRAERGRGWMTVEEPLALVESLAAAARPGRVALVDCLTLWLANLMQAGRDVGAEGARLSEAIGALEGPAILVSNEVGLGLVPETKLGRDFRDRQGRLNQEAASACDAVVFVAAGLPTLLKPAPRLEWRLRSDGAQKT